MLLPFGQSGNSALSKIACIIGPFIYLKLRDAKEVMKAALGLISKHEKAFSAGTKQ